MISNWFNNSELIGRRKVDQILQGIEWSQDQFSVYDGVLGEYLIEIKNRYYSLDQLRSKFGGEIIIEGDKIRGLVKRIKELGKKDAIYISIFGNCAYLISLRKLFRLVREGKARVAKLTLPNNMLAQIPKVKDVIYFNYQDCVYKEIRA